MIRDPLLGRTLGNYQLERLLGRGGMAAVYYATDVLLHRPAAVKVIDARFRDEARFTLRFVQEARAVAAWRHEHIVQIYYAGVEEGLYYFAMEFVNGTTLAQILKEQAAAKIFLPPEDVVRYGRAIASALDYAHTRGVIHRDVKPLNVLVSNEGRVILSDFGLALDTSQGSLGEVFGSPRYIAPEQARRSNAAVPQSDLYSLGVVLYEMLTGVVPFDDPSPASVALQQLTMPPPPPRQHNPEISEAVEAVLLKALAKNPSDRYPNGAALMDALEEALKVRPAAVATLPHPPEATLAARPESESSPPAADSGTGASQPAAGASDPAAEEPVSGTTPPPLPPDSPPEGARPARSPRRFSWLAVVLALLLLVGAGYVALSAVEPGSLGFLFPTMTPTQTLTATATLTPTATATWTASPSPTRTHTPSLTATDKPPTATETASPSALPPTATPTFTPTVTATPTPTFTPTLKYTDRRGFTLYYNATSFYMHQFTGLGDLIAGLDFERLDEAGLPLSRFSGTRWAEYASSSKLNRCFQLLVNGMSGYINPDVCAGKSIATLFLSPANPELFWTPQEGSSAFRVLWHEEELVRCAISSGVCVVYLP